MAGAAGMLPFVRWRLPREEAELEAGSAKSIVTTPVARGAFYPDCRRDKNGGAGTQCPNWRTAGGSAYHQCDANRNQSGPSANESDPDATTPPSHSVTVQGSYP